MTDESIYPEFLVKVFLAIKTLSYLSFMSMYMIPFVPEHFVKVLPIKSILKLYPTIEMTDLICITTLLVPKLGF